ncbi:NACHT domain-containing protein [Micromonospora haikouensis]|uniref:NACHT domain-containing protein n=1 Tax=Micromonospora haikouensis TaxID=686309 RepID=UPI0036958F3B
MIARLSLRSAGRLLLIAGLICLTVGLPAFGWTARNDSDAFNKQVGWANIWAGSLAGVGLLLMLLSKNEHRNSDLDRRVISLAKAQRISHSRQLAQLLGTDALEARYAKVEFSTADARTGKPTPHARTAGSIDTIADFYRQKTSGRMLILGAAGAGKSVIGIKLLLELIDEVLAPGKMEGEEFKVPVIFNLTSWPSGKDFDAWLAEEISTRFRLAPAAARELVQDKRILPMLDGLDEMDNESEFPDRADWAVRQLNDYIATNAHEPVVVISRSGSEYYSRLRIRLRNLQAISIKPIGSKGVEKYIAEHCGPDALGAIQKELAQGTRKTRDSFFAAVSTPWRLAMTVGYMNSGSNPKNLIPTEGEDRPTFTARLNYMLYETFLSTRLRLAGCKDQRREDRARRYLSRIAHLLQSPKSDEQSSDIVLHEWWRRFGARVTAWQSRAALLAVVAPFNLPLDRLPLKGYTPNPDEGWISWAMPLANFSMMAVLAITTPYQVQRPLALNLSRFLSSTGILRISLLLIPATGIGYFFSYTTSSGLLGAGVGIGLFILLVSLLGGRTEATRDATSPHAPIRRDFVASGVYGLGMGIFMGAYTAEVLGSLTGLYFGIGYFLSMTVGFAAGRYFVATVMGPSVGLPLRLSSHLRWANHAGILRVSGVSYQFRHRELMAYLRANSVPPPQMPLPGPFGIPMQRVPKWIERMGRR